MTDLVSVTQAGEIATVTLHRPEAYNAFNRAMRARFASALIQLESDPTIRIVVLHGSGRGFSAGVDLKEPAGRPSHEVLEDEFRPCLEPIWTSQKLYIASVHGHAAGIAAALVLACDLVVMETEAALSLAFAEIGLIPDGGLCWHLTQALGPQKALAAIIEGAGLPADRCFQAGLANRVVDPGAALDAAQAWARELAGRAPLAVSAAKALVSRSRSSTLAEMFSAEAAAQTRLAGSQDHHRGVAAFLARSAPVFSGD